MKLLVRDNFFENVEEIRTKALSSHYYRSDNLSFEVGWSGHRTKELDFFNDPLLEFCEKKILETVESFFSIENYLITTYFHISYSETKKDLGDFESMKYHSDVTEYAGIVYLNPNPVKTAGTSVLHDGKITHVENVYNRLVCYPGSYIHAPTDLFGDTIENGRMTLTFFVSKKFKGKDLVFCEV